MAPEKRTAEAASGLPRVPMWATYRLHVRRFAADNGLSRLTPGTDTPAGALAHREICPLNAILPDGMVVDSVNPVGRRVVYTPTQSSWDP